MNPKAGNLKEITPMRHGLKEFKDLLLNNKYCSMAEIVGKASSDQINTY